MLNKILPIMVALMSGLSVADIKNEILETAVQLQEGAARGNGVLVLVHSPIGKVAYYENLIALGVNKLGVDANTVKNFQIAKSEFAVTPKLIVEVVKEVSNRFQVSMDLITYSLRSDTFYPFNAYSESTIVPAAGAEEEVTRFIRRALRSRVFAEALPIREAKTTSSQLASGGRSTFNTSWVDPNGKRGRFQLGALVGAPTAVQLFAGYWGRPGMPIMFGISGGYLGYSQRSIQADLGLILQNDGVIKHGLGIWIGQFSESSTEVVNSLDAFGRNIGTTTTVTDSLASRAGISYFGSWGNIFGQVGVGHGVFGSDSSTSFLVRVGYLIPIGR